MHKLVLLRHGLIEWNIQNRFTGWHDVDLADADKAHPADDPGKVILQNLINLSRDLRIGSRVAFVEDYGEQLSQYLMHGLDIWLNNPLPPSEACGTSGMKASLNGEIRVWEGPRQEVLSPVWVAGDTGLKPFFIGEYPLLTEAEALQAIDAAGYRL